jgi:hypothetical protein
MPLTDVSKLSISRKLLYILLCGHQLIDEPIGVTLETIGISATLAMM